MCVCVCVCVPWNEIWYDVLTVGPRQKKFGKRCCNLTLWHILLVFWVCKTKTKILATQQWPSLKNTLLPFMAMFLNYFSMRWLKTWGGNKLPKKTKGRFRRKSPEACKTRESGYQIMHMCVHVCMRVCVCVCIWERFRDQNSSEGTRKKVFLGVNSHERKGSEPWCDSKRKSSSERQKPGVLSCLTQFSSLLWGG